MDRTWRVPWRRLDLAKLVAAATEVATGYAGVTVTCEDEDTDCHTAFFTLPDQGEESGGVVEISLYEVDGSIVMSLEIDASDNAALLDDADQLAEDLAEALDADPLDL